MVYTTQEKKEQEQLDGKCRTSEGKSVGKAQRLFAVLTLKMSVNVKVTMYNFRNAAPFDGKHPSL